MKERLEVEPSGGPAGVDAAGGGRGVLAADHGLESLLDGIAQLARFEDELARFEDELARFESSLTSFDLGGSPTARR